MHSVQYSRRVENSLQNMKGWVCIMKRNIMFFSIVISLIFLSVIILTGCMYTIATDNGEMKSYDLKGQKYNSEDDGGKTPDHILEDDAPAPQDLLKEKFKSMYDISEDGKSITVISEDYLKKYWQSNYEKEVIHSLTTEEVYFIIQDSIRIYEEYEEVVLTEFASYSSMMQVAERFPFVKSEIINTGANGNTYSFYDEEDISNIYAIIMYRLKALSSPKAFFTGEEAMISVGEEPGLNSTMLPWTTFYIPNYSESTNRDYILFVVGYGNKMNSTVIEDEFSELFGFCNKNGAYINFESKTYAQSTKVYPTVEMEKQMYNVCYADDNGACFRLYRGGYFSMSKGKYMSSALTGKYTLKDDVLTLILSDDHQYVFYYIENEGYLYYADYSTPYEMFFNYDEDTMFYEEDD